MFSCGPSLCHLPVLAKYHTGVGQGQGDGSYADHDTFEDDEGDLVVGEVAVETALELGDAEDGADVDA